MDVGYIVSLRYPVRCRHCRLRSFVSMFKVLQIRRQVSARREHETREAAMPQTSFLD
jgi:hypothetical protein